MNGYIYGHIAFHFRWQELAEGREFHWVEHHKTNKQDICRLLVSDKDYSDIHFDHYDTSTLGGPVYNDMPTRQWYHNNVVTTEFMIDADIPLGAVHRIEFVKHHPTWCAKHKWTSSCGDCKLPPQHAGALLLAFVMGTSRSDVRSLFASERSPNKVDIMAVAALERLCRMLIKSDSIGSHPTTTGVWDELMRATLVSVWNGVDAQRNAILSLFKDADAVETVFWRVVGDFFNGMTVDRD
ncbi:MAG: hypothetical protein RIC55_09460 [Pirellulaceae bacterium]